MSDRALVQRIIDDLRREADAWNRRSMEPGHDQETRSAMLSRYRELRRLANRYEEWLEKSAPR